jgi:hypothetical protein
MGMLDNPKHEAFANHLITEPNQSSAYRKAFPHTTKWKDEAVQVKASVLAKDDKVKVRVHELKAELASKCLWTREQSVEVVKEILFRKTDKEGGTFAARDADKLSGIKILNEMHGFNAPIEHNVKADLSHAVDLSEKDFDTLLAINDALKALPRE